MTPYSSHKIKRKFIYFSIYLLNSLIYNYFLRRESNLMLWRQRRSLDYLAKVTEYYFTTLLSPPAMTTRLGTLP